MMLLQRLLLVHIVKDVQNLIELLTIVSENYFQEVLYNYFLKLVPVDFSDCTIVVLLKDILCQCLKLLGDDQNLILEAQ